jgi:hypothetical protein
MIRCRYAGVLAVLGLVLLRPAAASAQQAWIADILANPARHVNLTVTLVGQVQDVVANPAGTTRGTYTLLDDSGPTPITVRTTDLPPVGRIFSVVGIVLQDPASIASTVPVLKEVSRSAASSSAAPYSPAGAAPRASIADIFANPTRYRNLTITLVGQIQDTAARPVGTTRGAYTLLDDSASTPIMVSTDNLPPIGKTFSVVGIVLQEPSLPSPVLKEVSRSSVAALTVPIPPTAAFWPATSSGPGSIAEILANPARHWNRTVTLAGEVQGAAANPAGTTRGTYLLLDDSSPTPMTVRSTDLPPVGRAFSVTGVVVQDPASGGPILKEISRASARR